MDIRSCAHLYRAIGSRIRRGSATKRAIAHHALGHHAAAVRPAPIVPRLLITALRRINGVLIDGEIHAAAEE